MGAELEGGKQAPRQTDHFGQERLDALPLVHTQNGKPKLAPARDADGTAVAVDPAAGARAGLIICPDAKQAHGYVVQRRPLHGGGAFNVKTPAAVVVLMQLQVSDHFAAIVLVERSRSFPTLVETPHDVERNHETRQEEHGPTVVASPVAVLALDRLVVRNCPRKGARDGIGALAVGFGVVRTSLSKLRAEQRIAGVLLRA